MTLCYNTVSDSLLAILKKLMSAEVFSNFRLVGGTALSLQRGHRRSIDIDLFTDVDYGMMPVLDIKRFLEEEFAIHEGTESLEESALGYHIRLGDGTSPIIKLDLFYTEPFIFPMIEQEGIRLADQKEIAAMKMLAIAGPIKRQKDYWDIHEMLSDYSFEDMVKWGVVRHPYSLTEEDILKGFEQIDLIEESPEGIDSLRPLDFWELKVMDLKEIVANYMKGQRKGQT